MKLKIPKFSLILVSFIFTIFTLMPVSKQAIAEEGVDLITVMKNLQYFTHKSGIAIRANNLELADFYAHEIEELLEELEKVKEYDGFPIGQLSEAMLKPFVMKLGEGLDTGHSNIALDAYGKLIETCNACHTVTAHGFIKIIDGSESNPYMQDFSQ